MRRCAGEEQRAPLAVDVRDRDVGDRAPGSFPPGEPSVGTLKAQEKYENGWACEDTARMWDCSPGSGVQPRTRASVAPQ